MPKSLVLLSLAKPFRHVGEFHGDRAPLRMSAIVRDPLRKKTNRRFGEKDREMLNARHYYIPKYLKLLPIKLPAVKSK